MCPLFFKMRLLSREETTSARTGFSCRFFVQVELECGNVGISEVWEPDYLEKIPWSKLIGSNSLNPHRTTMMSFLLIWIIDYMALILFFSELWRRGGLRIGGFDSAP